MDRRMYRGNTGNPNMNRNMPRRRPESGCSDDYRGNVRDNRFMHEDRCDDGKFEENYDMPVHDIGCDGTLYDRNKCDVDLDRFPIGMCYVPWQIFRNLYDNEFTALANGTLFKELDLKWYGRSCK